VDFTLIYEGELLAYKEDRAPHKQAIRKQLHPQLKELWRLRFPHWLNSTQPSKGSRELYAGGVRIDQIASLYSVCGYRFVSLVIEDLVLACKIDILFLRKELAIGRIIQGGDLDNRLKTLFDALRVPKDCKEIGGITPGPDENPFYCLLQDDILITEVKIRADTLLVPTTYWQRRRKASDGDNVAANSCNGIQRRLCIVDK
jgi:hypothetical protein